MCVCVCVCVLLSFSLSLSYLISFGASLLKNLFLIISPFKNNTLSPPLFCPSIYISLSFYLSIYLSIYLSVYFFLCLSICHFFFLSLSFYRSLSQSLLLTIRKKKKRLYLCLSRRISMQKFLLTNLSFQKQWSLFPS